jgi:hypothetical protein
MINDGLAAPLREVGRSHAPSLTVRTHPDVDGPVLPLVRCRLLAPESGSQ